MTSNLLDCVIDCDCGIENGKNVRKSTSQTHPLPTFTVCKDLTFWSKFSKNVMPRNNALSKPAGTTSILNQNISLFKPIMGESNFF